MFLEGSQTPTSHASKVKHATPRLTSPHARQANHLDPGSSALDPLISRS
jgi:hypothetical protein